MPDNTAAIAELKAKRAELAQAARAARDRNDPAEVARLQAVVLAVDAMLDRLVMEDAAALRPALDALRARMEAALERARAGAIGGALRGAAALAGAAAAPADAEAEEPAPEDAMPVSPADLPPRPAIAPAAPDPNLLPAAGGAMQLSEAHLIALWRRSLFPIDGRGLIVFGIRGMLPVEFSGTALAPAHPVKFGKPDYRTMCCTLGHWRPGQGLALFPGSTVPFGASVTAGIARGGEGVNQMGPGRYPSYQAGWHKRKEGRAHGHRALLQNCLISLQRTADDADFDADDAWDLRFNPGDNIHCARSMGPADNIPASRFSSIGCQVVAGTVTNGVPGSERGPWAKFIAPFQEGAGGPEEVEYVLFDGHEVEQMIVNRYAGKTVVLRIGSRGELVAEAQRALTRALGRTVKDDGDFGTGTFRAVLEFQQRALNPNANDGVIGPETAAALGLALPLFDFDSAIGGGDGLGATAGRAVPAPGPAPAGGGAALPAAAAAAAAPIAWGAVTDAKHGPAFKQKVVAIAGRLGCDPSDLMAVMAFETGESFAPDKRNTVSGATGLIQFMKATAEGLGTTQEKLAAMTAVEQLDFVERHIRGNSRGLARLTLSDLYMTVLLPSAVGRPESHPLFVAPSTAYEQNRGLDIDRDGKITKAEATAKVNDKLVKGMKEGRIG
jgi:hypothetical protein